MYQSVPKAEVGESSSPTVVNLQVEKLRLIAYIAFWGMCGFAIVMTKLTVAPYLGPCPVSEGDEPTYGLHCSVLMDTFGFNNICANWDYSPSREATAMIYPIFEYTLILYIVLDFFQIKNDYENGKVKDGMFSTANILFWVKIVLVAWFRMIFVCTVLGEPISFFGAEMPSVVAHTLGFFGMQFALILVAFENVSYLFYTGKSMFGMSIFWTQVSAVVYLVLLATLTLLKISWASSIFIWGEPWISDPWPSIFDRSWMLLAAFMPIPFSIYGMRTEPTMVISIVNQPQKGEDPIVVA